MTTPSFSPAIAATLFSASTPSAHAFARPAHAWPTKRAFYANHFYTGNEALEINI